jgi:hypothetical protein
MASLKNKLAPSKVKRIVPLLFKGVAKETGMVLSEAVKNTNERKNEIIAARTYQLIVIYKSLVIAGFLWEYFSSILAIELNKTTSEILNI